MRRLPDRLPSGPSSSPYHVPVLLAQVLTFLRPRPGGIYVDGTLGDGGYAEAILRESSPDGIVIGIDRDPEALATARSRLSEYGDRLRTVHATYDRVAEVVHAQGLAAVQGVVFDLGVSSRQLDQAVRGFSFRQDAPLDMRMDTTAGVTAAELVNTLPERELERVLREYGEERLAGRIARAIAHERALAPIETTGRLAQIIWDAVPASYRHGRIHPATRSFQAIRILVNREIDLLEGGVRGGVEILEPGAPIVVVAYHSLEDRVIKRLFRELAGKGFPAGEAPTPTVRLLTPKPLTPEPAEVAANPRARSAKLRAAEKLPPPDVGGP